MTTPYASREGTPQQVIAGEADWAIHEGEALDFLHQLPTGSLSGVITDPPYSSGGFTRGDRNMDPSKKYSQAANSQTMTFSGDSRDQRSFFLWCVLWLTEAQRATKEGGPIVQFSDWRQLPVTTDAIQAGGWVWRGIGCWVKGDASRPQMGRFRSSAEFWAWGTNGPSPDSTEIGCLDGHIFEPYVPTSDRLHLTQKPERVMALAVSIVEPGGVVCDPFSGSASTGVAALRSGRRFIGVERKPEYAEICRGRLRAETRGLKLKAAASGQGSIFDALDQSAGDRSTK